MAQKKSNPSPHPHFTLGIDPSFREPGFALMEGANLIDQWHLKETNKTQSVGSRLLEIEEFMNEKFFGRMKGILDPDMDMVVIETINVGKTSFKTAKKMAYVEGLVFMCCQRIEIPLLEIGIKTARLQAFGKGCGNMKKEVAAGSVRAFYGEHLTLDECDAITVAIGGQLLQGSLTVSPFWSE